MSHHHRHRPITQLQVQVNFSDRSVAVIIGHCVLLKLFIRSVSGGLVLVLVLARCQGGYDVCERLCYCLLACLLVCLSACLQACLPAGLSACLLLCWVGMVGHCSFAYCRACLCCLCGCMGVCDVLCELCFVCCVLCVCCVL